eukprot:CAMPEP_0206843376 /NCGR_PEP_ID=MMETSP0975-20121206/23433_1 /ASSEMBLY_ACC=CAM_ASM_000399 /TAXON_ID=483370 /ORGANISM="non described non described, Strain CCMP2097" /LENGTH=266 /DNA_ID=CAMNT_0054385911 /DNA_START=70 /DNA_END=867 /DNA_ORIENTATION=+
MKASRAAATTPASRAAGQRRCCATRSSPTRRGPSTSQPAQAPKAVKAKPKAVKDKAAAPAEGAAVPAADVATHDPFEGVKYTDKEVQQPVGNGGVAATHTWTQTLSEVTVYFEVPPGCRAKEVVCEIKPDSLRVSVGAALVDGAMYGRCKVSGSMWTLDRHADGRATLVVTLEKVQETWWGSVLRNAPPRERIDCSQVDSTKKMDEYDSATQAGIRKIMFDQRQKQLGLKTSEEIKIDDILDKCRHLPGSPFLDEANSPPEPPADS